MDRLRRAATLGEVLDFAPDAAEHLPLRRIPAENIRALLLEPGITFDPRGLQVHGALVTGTLDLDYAKVPCRIVFVNCRFENRPSFKQANIPELILKHVKLPGLSLRSARLTGDCTLTGIRSSRNVDAQNVRIGGNLELGKGKLDNLGVCALNLDGADINGDVNLADLVASSAVRAVGAHIRGDLFMERAELSNREGLALFLDKAEIKGGVFLNEVVADGEVRALGAHFGGQLGMQKAKLNSPGGSALSLDGAEIKGDAFLGALVASGEVRALGTGIGGQLGMQKAKLNNLGGTALNLGRTYIKGSAFLDGLESKGVIRALSVHVGGQLSMKEADLHSLERPTMILNGALIDGNTLLNGLTANGEVRALGAQFGGQFGLQKANLVNPGGRALNLTRSYIKGVTSLDGLTASGEVRAVGVNSGGEFVLKRAKLTNLNGLALNLSGATLGSLILDDVFSADGRLDLSFVTIHILSMGEKQPVTGMPLLSTAHGWKLGTVHGFLRTDRNSARRWLDTIDDQPMTGNRKEFASQPWKELARIYDQIGQPEDARRLHFWAAKRTTRVVPWTSKLIRWPYSGLVGYGYYPLMVLGWLTTLWTVVVILCFLNAGAFTPADHRFSTVKVTTSNGPVEVRNTGATAHPPNYPPFNAGLFAVETALPTAAIGQTAAWRVTENTWLPSVFAVIKGLAWILTALLLAGITGILRKE